MKATSRIARAGSPADYLRRPSTSLLQLAVSRIRDLKTEKAVQVKEIRRKLVRQLKRKDVNRALIMNYAGELYTEEKLMAAYEIVERDCDLISTRIPIIKKQKHCPLDLKGAIATIIYAGARCGDIVELQYIREHFMAKYGSRFIWATEHMPACGANPKIVEKLDINGPDDETKNKTVKLIAAQHNLRWDPCDFRNDASQKHVPAANYSENGAARPSTESQNGWMNLGNSSYEDANNPCMHRRSRNMNMQFMDAVSAAEAAAESAEIARMAAMAVAELVSREAMKRQYSPESCEWPVYDREHPRRSVDSVWKGIDGEVLGKMEADSSYWRRLDKQWQWQSAKSKWFSSEGSSDKQSTSPFLSCKSSLDDFIPTCHSQKPDEDGCLRESLKAEEEESFNEEPPSSPGGGECSQFSNEERSLRLDLGKLTGGLKHIGLRQPRTIEEDESLTMFQEPSSPFRLCPTPIISKIQNPKSPGVLDDGSASRESSLKRRPAHVHPRLPDYHVLKAYMDKLRTDPYSILSADAQTLSAYSN
ncbi:hypothetical protein ACLOJK_040041 [Asimina triloba]